MMSPYLWETTGSVALVSGYRLDAVPERVSVHVQRRPCEAALVLMESARGSHTFAARIAPEHARELALLLIAAADRADTVNALARVGKVGAA